MVFPFSRKREGESGKVYVPVNLVQKYASQGMSEQEIASILRSQGFSPGQIDAALRTVLRDRVREPAPTRRPEPPESIKEKFPTMQMMAPETGAPAPMPQRREPVQQMLEPREQESQEPAPTKFTFEEPENVMQPALEEVTLEEIIEGIVAEKWQDFEVRLANFDERDVQLQQQIQDMRRSVKDLEKLMERKEQDLSGRFEEFGGSMEDIQGRIGSIEKVFKDFIPELTRSIKNLSETSEKK